MTRAELIAMIEKGAEADSLYEGYHWEFDPKDLKKLADECEAYKNANRVAKFKCLQGGPVWLTLIQPEETSLKLWPETKAAES